MPETCRCCAAPLEHTFVDLGTAAPYQRHVTPDEIAAEIAAIAAGGRPPRGADPRGAGLRSGGEPMKVVLS